MTNRMNPGCCCGGCDLFRADFDLYCVVNEIPTTAADWVPGIDSGLSSSVTRRLAIAPGRPGEGLIYFQTQGLAPVRANKQRFIPEYSYHPAAAAIRALPDFSLYYYRIVDGYDIDDGWYILTPTSLSGPLTKEFANPDARLEEWPNYWRNHFRLMDGEGEVWGVVDPLPFVLQPDQYLESRRPLPAEWFSIDFRRLVYRTWKDAPGNAAELSLRADDEVISRLRFERGDATTVRMFDGDTEAKSLVPGPASLFSNLAMPYWWIHRAGHWDVSPWVNGSEWPNVVDDINLMFTFAFWQRSLDFAKQELANVRVNRTAAAARSTLRISLDGEPQRLGTIAAQKDSAPRLTTWPRIDSLDRPGARDINPSCGDRRSNQLVYPYGQVEWKIREFSIEGMVSPDQFQLAAAGRSIVFRHRSPSHPAFVAVADVPAYQYGASDFTWIDTSRVVANYTFESYDLDLQISPGEIGIGDSVNIREITAQLYEHDAQHLRLRVEMSADYFGTDLTDEPGEFELAGVPLTAVSHASGLVGIVWGTFTATAEEFVDDPSLFDPLNPELRRGWLRSSGLGQEFPNTLRIVRRPIAMQWDVILPKWEGDDYPEVEVTGAGYAWASPSDQQIRVLRRIAFDLESGTTPFAGEFTVTGELVPIDLASVKIRIGFDPPHP